MAVARRRAWGRGIALLLVAAEVCPAAGQSPENFPYLAALTADTVVRAGADGRYYAFGRVETGEVVKVVGEKAGWARVATIGPAFADFFGYVKYPGSANPSLTLSPDGRTASTIGPCDLFAPNLDARFDPGSSWKPTIRVPAGKTLEVLETVRDREDVVHQVALPPDAEGWIDLKVLRPAAPAEIAHWEAALDDVREQQPKKLRDIVAPVVEESDQAALGRAKMNVGATIDETPPVPAEETGAPDGAVAPVAPGAPVPIVEMPAPAVEQPRPSPHRLAQIMLDDLEAAYTRLLEEPIETAEVGPLRLLYLDLAERHPQSRSIAKYAQTRAKQLDLWAEVQDRRNELAEVRARLHRTTEEARAAQQILEASERYTGVGRLDASTIYDGKRLPQLLRLRDAITGRTIGYLQPDDRFDFANLLGRQVGVVGEREYDGGLRVTLIHAKRIDLLEPVEQIDGVTPTDDGLTPTDE